ncbi:MAG: glutathione S-transferase family protein [Rhodobacteraceae bacterium]|nr:glutathione S-transferase family protein [Paracoccaceae bacterium]
MNFQVYGARASRAFRVLWLLEEMELTYKHYPVSPHDKKLVKVSGQGRIPALVDDGQVITDSTAILNYLTDGYGQFTFPLASLERAHQDSLTQFILCEMDSCCWNAAKHSFVLPEKQRIKTLKATLKWEFNKVAEELCERINLDEYLMGTLMTVPDIILTHCLDWAERAKFDAIPLPLKNYQKRMHKRAAYKRVAQLD